MMHRLRQLSLTGLVVFTALILAFGIAMLYSTTAGAVGESIIKRQVIWIIMGLAGGVAVNIVGYKRLGRYSPWLLLALALPLFYLASLFVASKLGVPNELLAKFPFTGSGAQRGSFRWLRFGSIGIQPSEFTKVALILFIGHYYSTNPRFIDSFKRGLLIPMGIVGFVIGLILLGGSLSLTAITAMMVLGMLFLVGLRLRWFLIFIAIGLGLLLAITYVSPERLERLTSYQYPELQAKGAGYQLWHAQLALGSGGLEGAGFNNSHMKQYGMPEAHTDFIMAIAGEELGFIGLCLVMLAYLCLMASALGISITAGSREGMFVGFGLGMSLGLHGFANLGVTSGFLPTTGVVAPLVSYGGSGMIATWIALGILISIARDAERENLETGQADPEPESDRPVLVRYPSKA